MLLGAQPMMLGVSEAKQQQAETSTSSWSVVERPQGPSLDEITMSDPKEIGEENPPELFNSSKLEFVLTQDPP